MKLVSGPATAVLLLTLSLTHGGALWVSNSKGYDTNQLVDKDGILLTDSDPVIVAIGTFASEPATAIPGSAQNLDSGTYATLLAEFSSYGSAVGLLAQAGAADRRGSFIFQDDQLVAGTPLEGKPVYVLVAKGPDLAGAEEVAIIKTDEVFEAGDDDNPVPKLVGVGTSLGSTVIVGSDALYGGVNAAYNLAEIGTFGAAPTDIALSPDAVAENEPSGTVVGSLSATDPDAGDSFTYTLVAGAGDTDNGLFTIDVDELKSAATLDHEVQPSAAIRVRVVDSFGLDYEEALTVTITDDRTEDFDMDGLTEAEEEDTHGTSDTDPDSDDDGFEDGFEVAYGFDPVSDLDGTGDRDDDGSPDWLEDRLGTDGDVPGPGLDAVIYEGPSGQPMVRVGPGGNLLGFTIERSITLQPPWEEVADFPVGLPIGQSVGWEDHNVPAYPVMYRVRAYPLPLPVTAPDGFTWVTVGDPGNPADPATGHGAVAAEFQISAHEVTIGQWVEFLNAKEASQPVDPGARLYHPWMETDPNVGGIARSGTDGSYTYQAIGSPERPATFVSWLDAARYVNWLHNGKGSGDTESGVYDMSLSPEQITRAPGAGLYFLPTRDEWFKAAYYDPTKGGSDYWLYPTRSDTQPGNDLSAAANFANFRSGDYTLTPGDNTYSETTQYLTNGGSFAGSASHYGTYDQGGSVWEWTETLDGTNREGRGGTWGSGGVHLMSTSSRNDDPATENAGLGIRIAKPAGP